MIEIKKGMPSPATAAEINAQLTDPDWALVSPSDTKAKRDFFNKMNKSIIRDDLLKEQHYLCGYCMGRIANDGLTKIEHMVPLSSTKAGDKDKVLDYNNFLAVCDGGEHIADTRSKKGKKNRTLSCDAAKGDKETTICPHNPVHMGKLAYDPTNWNIYTSPQDAALEKDIKLMHLNGYYDNSGTFVCDTRTQLVQRRRNVYEVEYRDFIELLMKNGMLSSAIVKKRIDALSNTPVRKEYIGIALYFLQKKYDSLVAMGK